MSAAGKPVSRILIVRMGAMGDIIHTLPAAASLRASFPDARITWVVEPQWMPLLEGNPFLDRVVAFRRDRRHLHVVDRIEHRLGERHGGLRRRRGYQRGGGLEAYGRIRAQEPCDRLIDGRRACRRWGIGPKRWTAAGQEDGERAGSPDELPANPAFAARLVCAAAWFFTVLLRTHAIVPPPIPF